MRRNAPEGKLNGMAKRHASFRLWACAAALMAVATAAQSNECIAPAKPKAGFDLTCELVQAGLRFSDAQASSMTTSYMPGGIGAVTYNAIITQRNAEPDTVVAFSGGSLLGIAQGLFGRYGGKDVKWLAGIGIDHGVLIVRRDSPHHSLKDLIRALQQNPDKVVLGGSGTVGSQDWMKVALVAKAAKLGSNGFRFVGFEGGGEANAALVKGYVDVVSGDYSEALGLIRSGAELRVLTVMSEQRLPHQEKAVLTAREEGVDIVWSNVRGIYMGPRVTQPDYLRWVRVMDKVLANPQFNQLRAEKGLLPLSKTGADFQTHVEDLFVGYRRQLETSGLALPSRP